MITQRMYEIMEQYQLNLIFRMLVSCFCDIVIGFEHKNRTKEAGIRTYCIVFADKKILAV